jgi:hypothetical protein
VALGVVGLERLPGDNGLALAEGSLLKLDGALAEDEGHEDGPDVLSHVSVSQPVDELLVKEGEPLPKEHLGEEDLQQGGQRRVHAVQRCDMLQFVPEEGDGTDAALQERQLDGHLLYDLIGEKVTSLVVDLILGLLF